MVTYFTGILRMLWLRRETLQREEGVSTTEMVIITAAIAAVAITVTALIVTRIRARAESIDFG